MSRISDLFICLLWFCISLTAFGVCVAGEVIGVVNYHLGYLDAGVIACGFSTMGLYVTGRHMVWPTFLALF